MATLKIRQKGAALLLFMLIFFLASTSWLLAQDGSRSVRNQIDKTTAAALAQAKEALIGRAAADANRPGSLPCPAKDDKGQAELLVGNKCPTYVGRLPWKTLDLPKLLDGEGNTLWYVLAKELRDDDSAAPINLATHTELMLDGTEEIAAIVFSAGMPLADQNGRPSNNVADYLDGANRTGGPYVSGPSSPSFNDRLVAISRDQLFSIVNRRILNLFLAGLGKYYVANSALYPDAAIGLKTALVPPYLNTDTAALLDNNGWYALTDYETDPYRKQATLALGDPPAIKCTITPTQTACTRP